MVSQPCDGLGRYSCWPLDTPKEGSSSGVLRDQHLAETHFHPRPIWDRMFACCVRYKENREEPTIEATQRIKLGAQLT